MIVTEDEVRDIEVVAGTMPRRAGARLAASYVNFYAANDRIVYPLLDAHTDDGAAAVLAECFPDRRLVGVPAREIVLGGRQHPLHHPAGAAPAGGSRPGGELACRSSGTRPPVTPRRSPSSTSAPGSSPIAVCSPPSGWTRSAPPSARSATPSRYRSPFAPRTIVLLQDGAIRGFATYRRSRDRRARGLGELQALYVDPLHWRHGTGRTLMQEVYRRLSAEGVVEAILWVLVGNERAERFYRADGWLPDGTTRHERFWDLPVPVARFRRQIADLAQGGPAGVAVDA